MRQLKITTSITSRDSVSLEKYLHDISKEPLISAEEEVALAQRIKSGDQVALEKMVRSNLRFVISVAKQYQGNTLPLADLISEGNVGLIKAAQRFDETRGFKFISYAVWWIRQCIVQGITTHSRTVRLPLNQIGNLNKLRKALINFEQQQEREPTAEELAELLDFPIDKIETSLQNSPFPVSLDAPIGDSDAFSLGDLIAGNEGLHADHSLLNESLQIEVKRALLHLSPLERKVVMLYYGIGGKEEESLSNIADHYDLSRERIRQIKKQALRKLKDKMERKKDRF